MRREFLPHQRALGRRPGALVDPPAAERLGGLSIYGLYFGGTVKPCEQTHEDLGQALHAMQDMASTHRLHWLHFEGDVTAEQLQLLGQHLSLHPLALEDVLNRGQRPKLDRYDTHLFATLVIPVLEQQTIRYEQISVFMGEHFVVSFHAGQEDIFAAVRQRIHAGRGRMGQAESDYLGYCLADVVVDSGVQLLTDYSEQLERLEDRIFQTRSEDLIETIHALRKQLLGLRKLLISQNEMLVRWTHIEHTLIHEANRPYFRDVQDHAKRMVEYADSHANTAQALLDTHLSLASARLNNAMSVLTVIATIFMPLSFLTGLYGMNFDTKHPWNMPELSWPYGYPIILGCMGLLVTGLLLFFRHKRLI